MRRNIQNIALFALALFAGILTSCSGRTEGRERINFDKDWTFHLGEVAEASTPGFDDSAWRKLNLPHDWAIEGDFSKDNPSGTGGGALPGGIGWYRKTFKVNAEDEGRKFFIDFDGVYMNSEVFINGTSLGKRPYGYISFRYDMTPYLRYGEENTLAVRVDNAEQPNSRWYSGCGIYRHVWLTKTEPIHVAQWGTYATAQIDKEKAVLQMRTSIQNESTKAEKLTLRTRLVDGAGVKVAEVSSDLEIQPGDTLTEAQTLDVEQPTLWTLEHPYLYTIETTILKGGKRVVDTYETTFGFRTFSFDAAKGFTLASALSRHHRCYHTSALGDLRTSPPPLTPFRNPRSLPFRYATFPFARAPLRSLCSESHKTPGRSSDPSGVRSAHLSARNLQDCPGIPVCGVSTMSISKTAKSRQSAIPCRHPKLPARSAPAVRQSAST